MTPSHGSPIFTGEPYHIPRRPSDKLYNPGGTAQPVVRQGSQHSALISACERHTTPNKRSRQVVAKISIYMIAFVVAYQGRP
jgi:hypothetical protein